MYNSYTSNLRKIIDINDNDLVVGWVFKFLNTNRSNLVEIIFFMRKKDCNGRIRSQKYDEASKVVDIFPGFL